MGSDPGVVHAFDVRIYEDMLADDAPSSLYAQVFLMAEGFHIAVNERVAAALPAPLYYVGSVVQARLKRLLAKLWLERRLEPRKLRIELDRRVLGTFHVTRPGRLS